MQYLKIVFSNLAIDEPTWASSPLTIYQEYPPFFPFEEICILSGDPYFQWTLGDHFFGGQHLDLRYKLNATPGGGDQLARLQTSENDDFYFAYVAGNISGTWIDDLGVTWNITHYKDVSEALQLPSGEGGEAGIVFTFNTPLVQLGGEPPDKAQNPFPADDATNIQLVLPQLTWDAG